MRTSWTTSEEPACQSLLPSPERTSDFKSQLVNNNDLKSELDRCSRSLIDYRGGATKLVPRSLVLRGCNRSTSASADPRNTCEACPWNCRAFGRSISHPKPLLIGSDLVVDLALAKYFFELKVTLGVV
jgi:hypothetical protein